MFYNIFFVWDMICMFVKKRDMACVDIGSSVQILVGGKGICWKVGIVEELRMGACIVRLSNGLRVPCSLGDVRLMDHVGRGEDYRRGHGR